jgi:phosphoglycolate phosphatase-like HAD superfamily hydrolase
MRLTNYRRDAFVSAVMADVPCINYQEQAEKLITDDAYNQMPAEVKAVFDNKLTTHWLHTKFYYFRSMVFSSVAFKAPENYEPTPETREKLVALNEAKAKQQATHNDLKNKLVAAIYSVTTVKAARELLPEFLDYLPDEEKPTKNLPAVANLLDDLKAAGFPKGKKA